MSMIVIRTAECTVRDITGLVLECKRCKHALHIPLRQETNLDFPIDGHQACPVCGETWWGPRNLDEARGQPANPPTPPTPALVKAIRNAFRAEPSAVDVKLTVAVESTPPDGVPRSR